MRSLILLSCLLLPAALFAQERPLPVAPANSIYVGADGKFEADPDTAVVSFGISAQEESSRKAYERAAQAAEQIRKVLRSNGLDPKSAEMGFFSLTPVYDYRTPKRKLLGYRVNTSATVKIKDFSKIGNVVQQLADIDVTENQSLSYMLDDMDAAKAKAVEDAYLRARRNAAAVATAAGKTVGELHYSSVDVFEQTPIIMAQGPMMKTMRAAGAEAAPPPPTAEFSAQKIMVTAHVNALFLMK